MRISVGLTDLGRATVTCEASWLDRVLFGRRYFTDVVTRDPWDHETWYWSNDRRITTRRVLAELARAVARQQELERCAELQRGAYP